MILHSLKKIVFFWLKRWGKILYLLFLLFTSTLCIEVLNGLGITNIVGGTEQSFLQELPHLIVIWGGALLSVILAKNGQVIVPFVFLVAITFLSESFWLLKFLWEKFYQ